MTNIGKASNYSEKNALTTIQNPWNKFWNKAREFKKSVTPVAKQGFASTKVIARKLLHFNYLSLIAALLLVMASEAGLLESFPSLQWLAGAELRLWNWFCNLLYSFCNWFFEFVGEPNIPILDSIVEWLDYIIRG